MSGGAEWRDGSAVTADVAAHDAVALVARRGREAQAALRKMGNDTPPGGGGWFLRARLESDVRAMQEVLGWEWSHGRRRQC